MNAPKVAANEDLRRTQEELGVDAERLPFLCECDDEACRVVVLLTAADYALARADGERYIVVEGHAYDGSPVERGDGYVIVQRE